SSAGLRGSKGQVYEGGIRVPFVARWPGNIPAGRTTDHISAQYDLMATLADITDQVVSETDGITFLPTLLANVEEQKQHDYLYWEFPRGKQIAVRMGDLKGIKISDRSDIEDEWKVYNLIEDFSESTDIASDYPELIGMFEEIVQKRTPSHVPEWNY